MYGRMSAFAAMVTDGATSLVDAFVADEFVELAESRSLTKAETSDIKELELIVERSRGKKHDPTRYADCECRRCELRRLGGREEKAEDINTLSAAQLVQRVLTLGAGDEKVSAIIGSTNSREELLALLKELTSQP